MKTLQKYIHSKLVKSMLNGDDFIPIYSGDDVIDFVYRKG